MDRREFIEKVSTLGLTGLAGAGLISTIGCKAPASLYTKSVLEGNKVRVVKSDFPPKSSFIVIQHPTDKDPIYIHRENDNYMALHMSCTHKGCGLKAKNEELVCPCHGSRFDNKGQVLEGPAKKPLVTFKTSTDESNLFIEIM